MPRLTKPLLLMLFLAGCGSGANAPQQANSTAEQPSANPVVPATGIQQVAGQAAEGGIVPASATAPSGPSANRQVTYSEAMVLADEMIQNRDLNNALKVLTGAIKVQPTSADAYIKRAAILADSKLFTPAIADISIAIQIQPENVKLLNTRGYFYLLKEDLDSAEKDFTEAIAKDPAYQQPYNNRGLVYIGRQEFDKSIVDFEAALKIDPNYVDARNNLGYSLLQVEKSAEAIVEFTKSLEIQGDYVNALNNRGRAYQQLGKFEEAVADFSKAMELQPQNLQYQLHRAEAYKAWGKDQEAQADVENVVWLQKRDEYNRLLTATPNNADLWVGFGRHLALHSQNDDALKCYEAALKLKKDHAHALVGRGMLFMSQEKFEEAISDLSLALVSEPLLEAYSLRGDCHLKTGNLDAAIGDYEMAKRIDTHVVDAYQQRALKHEQAGEQDLSKADIERADALKVTIAERESAAKDLAAPRAPLTLEQASAISEELNQIEEAAKTAEAPQE